jgi:hypothetical protein
MNRTDSIRKEILLQLYGSRPLALSAERIERDARKQGYDFSSIEIARELQFQADETLVVELEIPGVAHKLYRIGSKGVRQFEQAFLA